MKKILVLSDLQCPAHNTKAVEALCNFMADFKPDMLLNVGDDTDSPEPSRWTKGLAGEYAGTLQAGLTTTHNVHAQFREALGADKPYHVMRSNHGDRVETYVSRYGPALASLDCLKIEELLGYAELGITYHRRPYQFAPRWLLMHGDEGGLSQTPGGTALSLARATGMSVVCGHTHKLGSQHLTTGFSGRQVTRWGVEVGHLMDVNKASYLKFGSANWSAGFAIFYVDGNDVQFYNVPVKADGSFICGGRKYRP